MTRGPSRGRRDATPLGSARTTAFRLSVVAGWLLPTIVLTGCSLAPPPRQSTVVIQMPESYDAARAGGAVADSVRADTAGAAMADTAEAAAPDATGYEVERWWDVFNDPILNALVDTALAANLDLREAVARVEQVRQQYRIARADLYPWLGLGADASYTSAPTNVGFSGQIDGDGGAPSGGLLPDRLNYWTYSASLGLSYEVDFWGRASNDTKAAVSEFLATESDYRTARLAVIAATISTYFEVVELRRAVALTRLSVDLLQERTELTDLRYFRGLVSSFELYTIRSLYRNTQAGLPVLESRLAEARGRLSVLLGRYAGQLDPLLDGAVAPAVVLDSVPTDMPAALLEQRPDVLAAWQRMEAARYRIGARKAEMYPAIRLDAAAGLQSGSISNLFRVDQYFLGLIGGLVAPLFQGGRLRANAAAAEAVFQQAAIAYVRSVLTAYAEVQVSLENLDNRKEQYEFLRQQQVEARASVDFQLRSFQRGVGDYIEYLDSRTNLAGVETNLATAERALGEARLTLHRALGGAWVIDHDLDGQLEAEYETLDDDLVPLDAAETAMGDASEEGP